jgi:TonB family protein
MNVKCIFLLVLLSNLNIGQLFAQIDTNKSIKNALNKVEKEAEYLGGEEALFNYLSKNIIYPKQAVKNEITGRVILEFVICEDGTVCNIKTVRSPDASLSAEAMRVVALMPKWTPAIQDNKKVACTFSLPITFALEREKPRRKFWKR